ncbi:MAG: GntR family transcriptional regulator [Alphaproteobacteria bacterium]|nr:GntR family transcriptional regulator [Alphaproteobacteria bacterium]
MSIRSQLKSGSGKLYEQIATLMRKRIHDGAWPAGGRVPVLSELTREFGVAVVTVRQALSILEAEGLIWRRQGKGTFVAERADQQHWIRLGTDWTSMIQVWATTEPQILNSRKDVSLPAGWEADGAPAPSYRYLRRLHRAHETPYAVLNIYLDSELWRLDPERFDTQMIIPFLQGLPGVEIAEARQTLTISTADLETAELLHIAVGTPVGEVRRRFLSPEGRILYSGLAVYRGDLVMLETVQSFASGRRQA